MANCTAQQQLLLPQPLRAARHGKLQASPAAAGAHSSRVWRKQGPTIPSLSRRILAAAAPEAMPAPAPTANDALIEELIEFLKEDLTHLFDDQGIDVSKYDPEVDFQDPITKLNSIQTYLLNIQFLRYAFAPTFKLHDIRRTGPWEITTRWTMTMRVGGAATSGPPRLIFTGTSIMGVNPETGRFNRHYDTWDAIQQQQFFSLEAFIHLFSQVLDLRQTPAIETPAYEVLKKAGSYEVRRYEAFPVAEAPMGTAGAADISAGVKAFQTLARYIFGGNARQEKMQMTTPVLTDGQRSSMQFVLPQQFQDPGSAPEPLPGSGVVTKRQEGGIFAAATFSGIARQEEAAAQASKLREVLVRDGLKPAAGWKLAQYNDPGVAPPFRRNEVIFELEDYKLW